MVRAIPILLKALVVAAAACVALTMLVYYVIVAVNWNDREPSALAQQWRHRYDNRAGLADSENAYVFAMGFTVAVEQDPAKMGAQRIAWAHEDAKRSVSRLRGDDDAPASDPLPGDTPRVRDAAVKTFRDACGPRVSGCALAFDNSDVVYDRWMATESWLLPRYQQLIGLPDWLETGPLTETSPLPKFATVIDGQRLLLLKARRVSMQGDYRTARDLLERDLRFWRHVLGSSDTLIGKMIATGALIRHFELGNLILRKLDPPAAAQVMPAGWHAPLTDEERSMQRCLVGEWIFAASTAESLDPIFRYELAMAAEPGEPRFGRTVVALLGAPLYQKQDSINQYADYYSRAAELLDLPLSRYGDGRAKSAELARQASAGWPPRSLYNLVGSWMRSQGSVDYFDYGARVADIEGVRRAALTAVTLRAAKVHAASVEQALTASELRSPYDDRPFEWSATERAIRFRGLRAGERGEHLLHY
jgi:hypothetical protein